MMQNKRGGGSVEKWGGLIVAALLVLNFAGVGLASGKQGEAHKMQGEIVKVEGEFVMIKSKDGKTHKFHVDKSTHLKGEVKAGSKVAVESTDSGHAISLSVVE